MGNRKTKETWTRHKNKFWKKIFTSTENLEEGFLYKHKEHLEDMVFWDNQRITLRGSPLKTGLHGNIAFGETKKISKITTKRHLVQTTTLNGVTTQNLKTRAQLENKTGKTLREGVKKNH